MRDTVLTSYERRSLLFFLLVYLGSLFFIITIVAFYHYDVQKKAIIKSLEYDMQKNAHEIAKLIVTTHMKNGRLPDIKPYLQKSEFGIGLFDFDGETIFSTLSYDVNPKDSFSHIKNRYYYLDDGTFDHLGVNYLILESKGVKKELYELKKKVFAGVLLVALFLSFVGFFLAKLFLRPLKNEIQRIDQFIKDSTHELNTPISSLLMSVKSLLKEEHNSKKLKRIEISARQISDIYNDISYLFLSDIDVREDKYIRMDRLIENRIEYLGALIEGKRLKVSLSLEILELKIDENRATLLLDNLLSNAIKYTPNGGKISVSLMNKTLKIEDSGIGVKDSQKKIIFERYKRADFVAGGFGIGLHIVRSIAQEYGFSVEVKDSSLGGALFIVYF